MGSPPHEWLRYRWAGRQGHGWGTLEVLQQPSDLCNCSVISDSATLRTVARQIPLFMGFSRQECWSGLPFPSPGALPDPGIEPRSPALQADSLPTELPGKPTDII